MAEIPTTREKPGEAKCLVYGLGMSGISVARYFERERRQAVYFDTRQRPPGLQQLRRLVPDADITLGELADDMLDRVDSMIVSPGIADDDPLLQQARAAGVAIVSDIDLFVSATELPFIAITGSNGKSTVATLLALMCNASGTPAIAGANLGVPALDLLTQPAPEMYILELSSFQLQRCRHLPATASALLNISPDHLDWHASEDEYRQAKYRVFAEAGAVAWNRADTTACANIPSSVAGISFGADVPGAGQYGIVRRDERRYLARGENLLLPAADIALVGAHNHLNALAALATGELIGLDLDPMLQVLREFAGLPHRMQFVSVIDGVTYINDSKATNVGAAVSSVESVRGLVVLIAGGRGKGGDFGALAQAVHSHLRAAVLIGEDASLIADALSGLCTVKMADDMAGALRLAREIAQDGDTVLLAPACASFDQFENYQVRGEVFSQLVRELAA